MGYPMSYDRVVARNHLSGDYDGATTETGGIAGDLRRLEIVTRDERHLIAYARKSGATIRQVKALFDAFFGGTVWALPVCPHPGCDADLKPLMMYPVPETPKTHDECCPYRTDNLPL